MVLPFAIFRRQTRAGRKGGLQIWARGRGRPVEEANGLLPEGIILDVSERQAGRP